MLRRICGGLVILSAIAAATGAEALPQSCLSAPFPATPQSPIYALDLVGLDGDRSHLELWRQPCADGSGQTAALARITPISVAPIVCSFDLVLVQDSIQIGGRLLMTASPDLFCDRLLTTATFILLEDTGSPVPFDASRAFTLAFEGQPSGLPIVTVDVPPVPADHLPPAITVVATGCSAACSTGQAIGFVAHLTNPGASTIVEVQAGVRLPDGTPVNLLPSGRHTEVPLAAGQAVDVTIIPTITLSSGVGAGTYLVEAAVIEPQLGVTLSRSVITVLVQ
jgi:hypothetical protein